LARTAGRKAERYDLRHMRAFINCSEPCKPHSFDRFLDAFRASGVNVGQLQCCYAMAETVFAVTQTKLGEAPARIRVVPASLARGSRPLLTTGEDFVDLIETGSAIQGIDVSICDEARAPLANGEVGEVVLSGRFVFSGYNKDPETTSKQLVDGRYFSRDLGFIHDEKLYVLGRIDDLIIINGRNLYAHEIEAQVNTVPGVKPGRAVAVSMFDDATGSGSLIIMAERLNDASHSEQDIVRNIMTAVHSVFNVAPRAVELLGEGRLVKTTSGKISRKDNLRRFLQTRNQKDVQPT